MKRSLGENTQAAIGVGVMMAVVSNVVYHTLGVEVTDTFMFGFFACAFVPTLFLLIEQ